MGGSPDEASGIVEVGSLHAILSSEAPGMGVSAVPRSIFETYTEAGRLSIQVPTLPFRRSRTLLIWRRDAPQTKVTALAQVLEAHN